MDTLDGINLEELGMIVSSWDDFLKIPDLKEPYSNDWPDQNGIEVDLDTPRFKAKTVNIPFALYGDNGLDFWAKYNALFNLLSKPGLRRLDVSYLNRTFFIYYQSCSKVTDFTGFNVDNEAGCAYNLVFIEPVPNFVQMPTPFAAKILIDNRSSYDVSFNNDSKGYVSLQSSGKFTKDVLQGQDLEINFSPDTTTYYKRYNSNNVQVESIIFKAPPATVIGNNGLSSSFRYEYIIFDTASLPSGIWSDDNIWNDADIWNDN